MYYEVKSRINWFLVLSDVIIGSILMSLSIYGGFNNFFALLFIMMIVLVSIILWRMQSYKIIVDDVIYFKRLFLRDYKISFEEIVGIKFYDDLRARPFSLKRAFLEVDTKKRYFSYYLDHFDLEEINELLTFLSKECDVTSIASSSDK